MSAPAPTAADTVQETELELPSAAPRRTLFAAASAAALGSLAAACPRLGFGPSSEIPEALHPDAEIIALAASITAGKDELEAFFELHCDEVDDMETPEEKARTRYLVVLGHKQAEELAALRATTMEGFRAKAAALMRYTGYDEEAINNGRKWWNDNDELLGWSLARDLLAGVG